MASASGLNSVTVAIVLWNTTYPEVTVKTHKAFAILATLDKPKRPLRVDKRPFRSLEYDLYTSVSSAIPKIPYSGF